MNLIDQRKKFAQQFPYKLRPVALRAALDFKLETDAETLAELYLKVARLRDEEQIPLIRSSTYGKCDLYFPMRETDNKIVNLSVNFTKMNLYHLPLYAWFMADVLDCPKQAMLEWLVTLLNDSLDQQGVDLFIAMNGTNQTGIPRYVSEN